jgi:hypothetical protein
MTGYKIFAYVFKLKPNVVVPHDYGKLTEAHYMCVHREPVAELDFDSPAEVFNHFLRLSLSPPWYKRGLKPLSCGDVVWYDGVGYLILPTAAGCAFFGSLPAERHQFGSTAVQEKQLDPEKILTCKV